MADNRSMAQRLMDQAKADAGLHTSRSDQNPHLTVKNADGKVTGHAYPDGTIKSVGGSGSLRWALPKGK